MFKLLTSLLLLLLVTASLLILEERKTFDFSTLVQIDPIPHTQVLIEQKKYLEAQAYLSYFMEYEYVQQNPNASKLLAQIQKKRDSFSYKKDKFFEGVIKGTSDEDIGRASAIASDFLLVGDIRDLAIEGGHYANDEEVDKLMVALSSLGILATATTLYSLGATAPIKGSISLLKRIKRANKIPLWLQNSLIKEIEIAKKTKSLKKIQILLKSIEKLYKKVGFNQTLYLLSKSRHLNELKKLNQFATRFGTKSQILLQITKGAALKYAQKMPHIKNQPFLYAATYGKRGLKGLEKLGSNRFMKRVGFNANLAKTTYKGNFNSLFNTLLNKIPNTLLYAISFLGLFYFVWKFFKLARKLF